MHAGPLQHKSARRQRPLGYAGPRQHKLAQRQRPGGMPHAAAHTLEPCNTVAFPIQRTPQSTHLTACTMLTLSLTNHHAGAKMTVLQFAYVLLHEKRASRLGDGALDRLLRLLQEVILPAGNHCPPSLHVLKRVLGVGQVSKYEQHVCVNDKCRFAYVPKKQYAAHANDTCACGERRFDTRQTRSGKIVYTARKVCVLRACVRACVRAKERKKVYASR